MNASETAYLGAGKKIKGAEESQLFGKPCFKIGGKAFICFFQDCAVFKLTGDQHAEAITLKGAQLFDPSGKGRAMKEWVQLPYEHHAKWNALAKAAAEYVNSSTQ